MNVKDAISEIKEARQLSKFLYSMATDAKDEHISDFLEAASDMLDRYIATLEEMKVQRV